jgi:DNA-damage-inducible protein J
MNSAVINIKTDVKVKKEAQKIVSDLGLSLSGAINGFLKQLVRTKTISFTLNENNPSDYLINSVVEAKKERISKKQKKFQSNADAIDFINTL